MKKLIVVALITLAGCANQSKQEQAAPERAPTVEPTVRQQFPVRVRWEERSLTATSAVVVAHVERLNALSIPFLMRVEVPAGVKVVRGRAKLELLANTEAVETTEEFEFSFAGPPATDALLLVDGDTQSMGFHSKVEYRFGRPAPEGAQVTPSGSGPAGKGGKPLGASVPLSP